MDKVGFIDSPESMVECNQLLFPEQMFRFSLVHNKTILEQSTPHPLTEFTSAKKSYHWGQSAPTSYICFLSCFVTMLPVIRVNAAKKPLCLAVQGFGGHPGGECSVTGKGKEAKEILRRG